MPSKTEAEQIKFLLAVIEHSEKIDLEQVARSTGFYKSGKSVRQALNILKTKYGSASAAGAATASTSLKSTRPKSSSQKRMNPAKDNEVNGTPSKKAKKVSQAEVSEDELGADKED